MKKDTRFSRKAGKFLSYQTNDVSCTKSAEIKKVKKVLAKVFYL